MKFSPISQIYWFDWGFSLWTHGSNHWSILRTCTGLPFCVTNSVGHWGNKLDTNWTKRSKNMKSTLIKYVNWVARSNNKCCGVDGEGAILSQVWGAEVSWASSTFLEDLLSARHIPGCKNPKMGQVEIGWHGFLVLQAGQHPCFLLFCPWNLSFPLRIPCPLWYHLDGTNDQGALARG